MKLRFLFAFMLLATLAMSQDVFRFTTSSGNQARAYFELSHVKPSGSGVIVFTKDAINGIASTSSFQSIVDSACGELTVINDLKLGQIAIPNSGVGKIAPKTNGGCILTMYNNNTRTYEATQSFTSVVNMVRTRCGGSGGSGESALTLYTGNGSIVDDYRRVTMNEYGIVSFVGEGDSVTISEQGSVMATRFTATSQNFTADQQFTNYESGNIHTFGNNTGGSLTNNIALRQPNPMDVSYSMTWPNDLPAVGDVLKIASMPFAGDYRTEWSTGLTSANNGLTLNGGTTQLGGSLIQPTTISTSGVNTLALTGLVTSYVNADPLVVDASGVIAKGVNVEEIVEFNSNNPNSGSPTFTPNTPSQFNTIYASTTNGTTWVWNGTAYVTAPIQTRTPFFLANTTTDAGNNKTAAIYRNGRVGFNTNNPSTQVHINTNNTNASGLRLEDLTSYSPATVSDGYLAVSSNGTVVRATTPLLTETLQTLSIAGSNLSISGGNTVALPVGAGDPTMGGDISGLSSDATVEKIQNVAVSTEYPSDGYVYVFNAGTLQWEPEELLGQDGNGIYGGSGTLSGPTTVSMDGNDLTFDVTSGNFINLENAGIDRNNALSPVGMYVENTDDGSYSNYGLFGLTVDNGSEISNLDANGLQLTIPSGATANYLNTNLQISNDVSNYAYIDPINISVISADYDFTGGIDALNQEIIVQNIAGTIKTSVGAGGFKFGPTTPTVLAATPSTGETFTLPTSTPFDGFMTMDASGQMGVSQINEIQNVAVSATAPTNGQVLTYNNGTGQWEPQTPSGGSDLLGDKFIARSTHFNDYPFFIQGIGAGWENTAWGSGGSVQQPALAGRAGISVINLNVAAALSGSITSWGNGNVKSYFPTAGARVRASVNVFTQAVGVDSAKMRIGFFSRTANMNRGRYGAYFELGTGGTAAYSLYAVTCNTTNATYTSLPANMATLFTNWRAFEVKWATATTVEFYIDNVLVATHTTNVPDGVSDVAANRMYPAIGFGRVGSNAVTSSNTVSIDYILFEMPTTRL